MKILVTQEEIALLIREKYKLDGRVEVEIDGIGEVPMWQRTLAFLKQQPPVTMENRIPLIKGLREVVPGMGLFQAKYLVENWDKWENWIAMMHRLPPCPPDGASHTWLD